MPKAYIRTDTQESSEVLDDLKDRLLPYGIQAIPTNLDWRKIKEDEPFLYFRTPYLRFANEAKTLAYHLKNFHIPFFVTVDGELISVNTSANLRDYPFMINTVTSFYQPKQEPLPILLGTHQRPTYLQLTLNSLVYNLKDPRQKLYLVISQPDPETLKIVNSFLKKYSYIQAVLVVNNL